jgi:crotonobetainyl-CoA:carnitine CoA-transferase CaiB-like acyl-CoA transferase
MAPLSHIRVLDLSRVMAGPWSSQILADLGADVIKVERPGVGDDTRAWGPPFANGVTSEGQSSGYFLSVNRGKRSIALDLADTDDRNVVLALADRADIVLENFKVGTLTRMGLDAATLRTRNPRLIYASITGFGQDGPRAPQAAYDFMIQALGGLMSLTGEADDRPGGGPQKVGVPIVDIMTGMYATVGILAALANREITGVGDHIDIAMLDVQTAFLANQAMNHLLTGTTPRQQGNRHPNIQPQDVYLCRTGRMALAVGNDRQFRLFCAAMGNGALADDTRFGTNAARVEHVDALRAAIIELFAPLSTTEISARLDAVGVPCAPINSIPDTLADPQVRHRAMLHTLPHGQGEVPSIVSPLRFVEAPLVFDRGPPTLDEHRGAILSELGWTNLAHKEEQ